MGGSALGLPAASAAPEGSALPPGVIAADKERRLVTVLFSDMVGSTTLGELLDAEQFDDLLSTAQNRLTEVVEHFGGHVAKYLGDGMMALFGAPIAREDDAERAVLAGLKMIEALQEVNETRLHDMPALQMRVGITTGEVISREYIRGHDVVGDAANTAARLQSAADVGGVLVSSETVRLARRGIYFGEPRELSLKGKADPVKGYPALRPHDHVLERWEMHEERIPLIGRERELEMLMEAWSAAVAGRGSVFQLSADPGVGKSRLLAEGRERIVRHGNVLVVRGRCLSYSEELSLWLVSQILRDTLAVPQDMAPGDVASSIAAGVDALLTGEDERTRAIARDVFGETLGLPPGGSVISGASAQVRRQGLLQSLRLLLRGLAAVDPVLLVLEDLHWLDVASREVLADVLSDVPALKMLILITRRDEGEPLWTDVAWLTDVALQPLGEGDATQLARAVLGGAELSSELERNIFERAAGNPFFVEELLRSLQEAGQLDVREGRAHLIPGAQEHLPSTLHEVLIARLDRLERPTRFVAQVGSVIGRRFAVRLLSGVVATEEVTLEAPLDALQRAQIALPRPDGERSYVFKHATVQEVAYNTLLKKNRQVLHGQTARAVMALYPDRDNVDVIAYHFGKTEEHAEAVVWLERAGDRAAAVYANATAIDHYSEVRRRQDLIEASPADRARVDEKLGHVLRLVARYDEALEVLERAAAEYGAAEEPESERRTVADIGRVHRARNTPNEGIERITELLQRHVGVAPSSGLAALHVALARLYFNIGKYPLQAQVAQTGSELASLVGDRRLLAEAEFSRGTALNSMGRIEDGLGAFEAAIPVAEAVGDFEVLYLLLGNTAYVYREAGEFEKSRAYRERSAEVAERIGDPAGHSFAVASVGHLLFYLGDWEGAHAQLDRAAKMVRSLELSWFSCYPPTVLGQLYVAMGEFEAATACLEQALSLATEGDFQQGAAWVLDFLAEMDVLQGRPEDALRRFDGVLDLDALDEADTMLTVTLPVAAWAHLECGRPEEAIRLAGIGARRAVQEHTVVDLLDAQRVGAMAAARLERWAEADSTFKEMLALAREVQYPYAEGRILYEWGLALLAQGDMPRGRAHLSMALAIFQHLGAKPYLQRAEEALVRFG